MESLTVFERTDIWSCQTGFFFEVGGLRYAIFAMTVIGGVLWEGNAWSQEAPEEKLYNFDDMLIDGAFRDPQGMFERASAEAEFESVLKISRTYLDHVEESAQETPMRP